MCDAPVWSMWLLRRSRMQRDVFMLSPSHRALMSLSWRPRLFHSKLNLRIKVMGSTP